LIPGTAASEAAGTATGAVATATGATYPTTTGGTAAGTGSTNGTSPTSTALVQAGAANKATVGGSLFGGLLLAALAL